MFWLLIATGADLLKNLLEKPYTLNEIISSLILFQQALQYIRINCLQAYFDLG